MTPLRRLSLRAVAMTGVSMLLVAGPLAAAAASRPASASRGHRVRVRGHQRPGASRRGSWISGVRVTEYFPVPERWFVGRPVPAPGLDRAHRVDWLYSARGVTMEGDGIDLTGQPVHVEHVGRAGWINAAGRHTASGRSGSWGNGLPFWRAGAYWLTSDGAPTFPLASGGWAQGTGARYVPLADVTFAPGPSRALHYYQSVAVDPRLIPLGSRIFIRSYREAGVSSGWFVAADTGGAIKGAHLDVYRPAPESPADGGRALRNQRVYVVPPGARAPRRGAGAPPPPPTGGLPTSPPPGEGASTGGSSPAG